MSASTYPLHVTGQLDPSLSRGLWLVKWLLAIPHYLVLAVLWLCFAVLSVVAFFAILLTGRYPRGIFEFNVGVMRWSWRVAYYAYGALGTDRYPPFTLDDVPDYPAHLDVAYPDHLSRGLVLVKWWLLAIPQYVVVAVFCGGLYTTAQNDSQAPAVWGGLIGVLVLVAGVVLLFTGRYPRGVFDLLLGLNRWVLRVAAYVTLMTDQYPPFRLDLGGDEPNPGALAMTPAGPGYGTAAPPPPQPSMQPPMQPPMQSAPAGPQAGPQPTRRRSRWGAGRVVMLVLGVLSLLVAGGLLTAGTVGLVVDRNARDADGFLMTSSSAVSTGTYAVVTRGVDVRSSSAWVLDRLVGDLRVTVEPTTGPPVFVGVAPTADVQRYLGGVSHTTVTGFQNGSLTYRSSLGSGAPQAVPGARPFWLAHVTGSGRQTLTWPAQNGRWSVVLMNADGTAAVSARVAVGATLPSLGGVVTGLLVSGTLLLLLAVLLIVLALVTGRRPVAPVTAQGTSP